MRDDDSYNLRKLFEEIELDLIKSMKRTFKLHEAEQEKEGFKWEQWQSAKLRNIIEYRNRNKGIVESKSQEIEDIVNKALDSNYKKGQGFFTQATKKIGNLFFKKKRFDTPTDVSDYKTSHTPKENDFFGVNDKKLEAMKEVVNNDLKKGQQAILRRMDDVYRQTIYKAEIHMAAGAKTLDQAIDKATKEFLNKGIDCIEYKDGKRVNIASYAEMALRTASHRATLLGEGKKRDEWGIHTVVVSAHGNTCPKCEKWQGEILIDDVFSSGTMEEAIEGRYYLLSFVIQAGLLHPNCRHSIFTYFPGITQIPTTPNGKEAVRRYEAEQEQRRLEREIKKWKRIAEGSQDPDNINDANSKVREHQEQLREHLKKHSYLRRDYSREKMRDVPVTDKITKKQLAEENQNYIEKYSAVRYNEDGTVKVTDDWKDREHPKIPKKYKPNAIIETKETKAGATHINRTYYDNDKKMIKQVHSGNHGNVKNHPLGEHVHIYEWEAEKIVKRFNRELTEDERKESADIL